MTNKEKLQSLYTDYNLSKEDVYKSPQGWVIITRSGIDKIQAAAQITVDYEVLQYEHGVHAAVKAIARNEKREIQTFGTAVIGGFPKGNTKTSYILEMAEKRAMSRAVLKLAGFYELGVFGEDESEDFKKK